MFTNSFLLLFYFLTCNFIIGSSQFVWSFCTCFGIVMHNYIMLCLFHLPPPGWQTVVSHGSGRSANILDCFLTLKTEVPIMTEEQKQDLNPLTIKIKCVSCLPSQPVPIHELEVSMSQANWFESFISQPISHYVSSLSTQWLSMRCRIKIPILPFRISQQDMKKIRILGLGATKSWVSPQMEVILFKCFFKWR